MQPLVRSFSWLFVAMLSFSTFTLIAQDAPLIDLGSAPVGPTTTIEFEELTYDFGTILEGTQVVQVFTFTNTGNQPLILTDARGSCGCTVPQWPREPIMPGETASITVEFNSKNKMGKRRQRVTLTANTDPAQTFLALTGEITPRGENTFPVGMPEAEPEMELDRDCFAIFPNPTSEVLQLKMEAQHYGKRALISIFSKSGQLMAKREIQNIDGTIEFNVSHYPGGTYMANVQIGGGKPETRCFVVVD